MRRFLYSLLIFHSLVCRALIAKPPTAFAMSSQNLKLTLQKKEDLKQILQKWAGDMHCSDICMLGAQIDTWVAHHAPHLHPLIQDLALFCQQQTKWRTDLEDGGGWRCARVHWRTDEGSKNDQLRRQLVSKIEVLVLEILRSATGRTCVGIFERVGTRGYLSDIDTAFIPHPRLAFEYRIAAKLIFDAFFCFYLGHTPAFLIDTECYLQQVGESLRTEQLLHTSLGRALFAQEQIQAALIKFRQSLKDCDKHWQKIGSSIVQKLKRNDPQKAIHFNQMLERIQLLHIAMHRDAHPISSLKRKTSGRDLFSFNDCALQCIYSRFLNPLQVQIQHLVRSLKRTKSVTARQELEQLIDQQRVQQALFGTLAESCTAEGYITQGAFRDVVTNRGGQYEHNLMLREMQLALDPMQLPRTKGEMALFPRYELSSPLDRFISSMENFFLFEAHLRFDSERSIAAMQKSWIVESKYAGRALKNGIITFDRLLQRGEWDVAEKQALRTALALGQEKLSYVRELEQIKRGLQISRRAYEEAIFPLLAKALTPAQIIQNLTKTPLQAGPWIPESESTFILYEKILNQLAHQSVLAVKSIDIAISSKGESKWEIRSFPLLYEERADACLNPSELTELNQLAMAYAGIPWKFFALARAPLHFDSQIKKPFIELDLLEPNSAQEHDALFDKVAQTTLKQCELCDLEQLQCAAEQIREFQLELLVRWIEQQDLFSNRLAEFALNPHAAWIDMMKTAPILSR